MSNNSRLDKIKERKETIEAMFNAKRDADATTAKVFNAQMGQPEESSAGSTVLEEIKKLKTYAERATALRQRRIDLLEDARINFEKNIPVLSAEKTKAIIPKVAPTEENYWAEPTIQLINRLSKQVQDGRTVVEELTKAKEEIDRLEGLLKEKLDATNDVVTKDNIRLKDENGKLKEEIEGLNKENKTIKSEKQKLQSKNQSVNEANSRLTGQIGEKTGENERLQGQIADIKTKIIESENIIETIRKENAGLKTQLENEIKTNVKLIKNNEELKTKQNEIEQLMVKIKGDNEQITQENNSQKSQIDSQTTQITNLRDDFRKQNDETIMEKAKMKIMQDAEKSLMTQQFKQKLDQAIADLTKNKDSSSAELTKQISDLQQQISDLNAKIKSCEEDLAKSKEEKDNINTDRQQQIEKCREDLEKCNTEKMDLQQQNALLNTTMDETHALCEEAKRVCATQTQENIKLQANNALLNASNDELLTQLQLAHKHCEEAKQACEIRVAENDALRTQIAKYTSENDALRTQLDEARNLCDQAKQMCDLGLAECNRQKAELEEKNRDCEEAKQALMELIKKLEATVEENNKRITTINKTIEDANAKITELTHTNAEGTAVLEQKIVDLGEEKSRIEQLNAVLNTHIDALKEVNANLQTQLDNLQKTYESATTELEMAKASNADIESLVEIQKKQIAVSAEKEKQVEKQFMIDKCFIDNSMESLNWQRWEDARNFFMDKYGETGKKYVTEVDINAIRDADTLEYCLQNFRLLNGVLLTKLQETDNLSVEPACMQNLVSIIIKYLESQKQIEEFGEKMSGLSSMETNYATLKKEIEELKLEKQATAGENIKNKEEIEKFNAELAILQENLDTFNNEKEKVHFAQQNTIDSLNQQLVSMKTDLANARTKFDGEISALQKDIYKQIVKNKKIIEINQQLSQTNQYLTKYKNTVYAENIELARQIVDATESLNTLNNKIELVQNQMNDYVTKLS